MLIASLCAAVGSPVKGLHCNELKTPCVEKRSTRVPFCVRNWSQSHWPFVKNRRVRSENVLTIPIHMVVLALEWKYFPTILKYFTWLFLTHFQPMAFSMHWCSQSLITKSVKGKWPHGDAVIKSFNPRGSLTDIRVGDNWVPCSNRVNAGLFPRTAQSIGHIAGKWVAALLFWPLVLMHWIIAIPSFSFSKLTGFAGCKLLA